MPHSEVLLPFQSSRSSSCFYLLQAQGPAGDIRVVAAVECSGGEEESAGEGEDVEAKAERLTRQRQRDAAMACPSRSCP